MPNGTRRQPQTQAQPAAAPTTAAPAAEQSVGKKVISDISGAQITASALAAVTSLFFSSNIGLAGSVIGVAASAAVTALSSSIYKSFIEGTKQKAKAKAAESERMAAAAGANGATETTQQFKREAFTHSEAAVSRNSGKYTHAAAKRQNNGVSGRFEIVNKKWFAVVVMTIVGLVTVFITAGIITSATGGEGIGTKTEPIIKVHDDKQEAGVSTDSLSESTDTTVESSSISSETSDSESSQTDDQSSSSDAAAYQSSSSGDTDDYSSSSQDTAVSSSSANVSSSRAAASSSAGAAADAGSSSRG